MAGVALFVIDIQAELVLVPETAIPHASRIREVGAVILNRARNEATKKPLIVTVQHSESADDPNATMIPGSKAWELVFPPKENEEGEMLVHKTTPDTFQSNPQLADQLKSKGVRKIVAFGVQSDVCVRATCRGAVDAGFDVVLLQGAHSTYDNSKDGTSAADVELEIEAELEEIGVSIVPWDMYTF